MAKTDTDIQELKAFIGEQFEQVNRRLDKLDERVKSVEDGQIQINTSVKVIEARLDEWKPSINKVSDLAKKVGELKNWRQIALVVITGTFGSLFGWFLRGGK